MDYHIAIDVGGTQIRAACYPSDSLEPLQLRRASTQDEDRTPLQGLIDLVRSIWPEDGQVRAIGMASPGPLDPFKGVVLAAPNIPGWDNMPIQALLEDEFQVPVVLGNDANLAALGEWKYGAGQGHHHLVYITVSTGIGGGVLIDDKLLLGERGLATELGHVTVMIGGPMCGCGQPGHLEALAAGPAIAAWAQQQLAEGAQSSLKDVRRVTAKEVANAALKGDELARKAMARAGEFIGIGLANYLHIFNPTMIIIGGGVSLSGDLIMEPIRASLKKHVITPHYLENLTLTTAALGDKAGLIGALIQARELSQERQGRLTKLNL